jgi:hypothetical protein
MHESDGFSRRFKFSEWPNAEVPRAAAGVYAIWREDELIYCGMSGRSIVADSPLPNKAYGLKTRLHSHAGGRLSGDQFCVYVANRLVLPALTAAELADFATGRHTLDAYTRRMIHAHFKYQFKVVATGAEAMALEDRCCRGVVFGVKPLLNPRADLSLRQN